MFFYRVVLTTMYGSCYTSCMFKILDLKAEILSYSFFMVSTCQYLDGDHLVNVVDVFLTKFHFI